MARIGSVAAAPFVGDEFASLYLGATRVPTVPGKPVIASASQDGGSTTVNLLPPTNNGGTGVSSYIFYIEDLPVTPNVIFDGGVFIEATFAGDGEGDFVQVAAVNAIGEGPKSTTVQID